MLPDTLLLPRILFCCIHSFIIYVQQSLIVNSRDGSVLLLCASIVLLPHWGVSGNIRLIGTVTLCGHWWLKVSDWLFICVCTVIGFKSASCLVHAGTGPSSLCMALWYMQSLHVTVSCMTTLAGYSGDMPPSVYLELPLNSGLILQMTPLNLQFNITVLYLLLLLFCYISQWTIYASVSLTQVLIKVIH